MLTIVVIRQVQADLKENEKNWGPHFGSHLVRVIIASDWRIHTRIHSKSTGVFCVLELLLIRWRFNPFCQSLFVRTNVCLNKTMISNNFHRFGFNRRNHNKKIADHTKPPLGKSNLAGRTFLVLSPKTLRFAWGCGNFVFHRKSFGCELHRQVLDHIAAMSENEAAFIIIPLQADKFTEWWAIEIRSVHWQQVRPSS